jgi:hypothetical protein
MKISELTSDKIRTELMQMQIKMASLEVNYKSLTILYEQVLKKKLQNARVKA